MSYPGSPYGGQAGSTAPLPPPPPTDPRGSRQSGPRAGTIIAIIAVVIALALVGAVLLYKDLHGKNNAGPTLSPAPTIHTHHGSTSSAPVTSGGAWYAGVWTGTASQPNAILTSWTVDLSFVSTGKTGVFVIPALDCSGLLNITSSGPNSITATEVLLKNSHNLCATSADMTLTKSGSDGMHMSWQDLTNPDNTATASLTRLRG